MFVLIFSKDNELFKKKNWNPFEEHLNKRIPNSDLQFIIKERKLKQNSKENFKRDSDKELYSTSNKAIKKRKRT